MTAAKYHEYAFSVPAFGSHQIEAYGEFLICLDGSTEFKISFDDAPKTTFKKGLAYKAMEGPFRRVRIDNEQPSEIGVTVGIGSGGISDNRFVVSGSIETEAKVADDIEDLPAVDVVGVAQIAGADARRKEVIIRNLSDTGEVWIKGVSTATESGMLLRPSEAVALETTGAVYAYNPTLPAVRVAAVATREAV